MLCPPLTALTNPGRERAPRLLRQSLGRRDFACVSLAASCRVRESWSHSARNPTCKEGCNLSCRQWSCSLSGTYKQAPSFARGRLTHAARLILVFFLLLTPRVSHFSLRFTTPTAVPRQDMKLVGFFLCQYCVASVYTDPTR